MSFDSSKVREKKKVQECKDYHPMRHVCRMHLKLATPALKSKINSVKKKTKAILYILKLEHFKKCICGEVIPKLYLFNVNISKISC